MAIFLDNIFKWNLFKKKYFIFNKSDVKRRETLGRLDCWIPTESNTTKTYRMKTDFTN